eukprot:5705091-Pleurochrysis_carterae.AAC.1
MRLRMRASSRQCAFKRRAGDENAGAIEAAGACRACGSSSETATCGTAGVGCVYPVPSRSSGSAGGGGGGFGRGGLSCDGGGRIGVSRALTWLWPLTYAAVAERVRPLAGVSAARRFASCLTDIGIDPPRDAAEGAPAGGWSGLRDEGGPRRAETGRWARGEAKSSKRAVDDELSMPAGTCSEETERGAVCLPWICGYTCAGSIGCPGPSAWPRCTLSHESRMREDRRNVSADRELGHLA